VLTLGNSEAIALAVEEGIGVGFVSELVATKLVAGRVACVSIRGVRMVQQIHMLRHSRRPATAIQTAFWDFVFSQASPALAETGSNGAGLPAAAGVLDRGGSYE
jgi:DNA-binding transcriptional LysR family regulator